MQSQADALTALTPAGLPDAHRAEHAQRLAALLAEAERSAAPMVVVVDGAPGTGKTCTVRHFLAGCAPRLALYWNPQAEAVAPADAPAALERFVAGASPYATLAAFRTALGRGRRTVVLAIDEYESVAAGLTPVLAGLVAAPSRLFLVTVTNDLNGPKAFGLPVRELAFAPYTADELQAIIAARLEEADVSPPALRLLARRASNAGGDARTALTLARTALQAALAENKTLLPSHVPGTGRSGREGLTPLEELVLDAGPRGQVVAIKRRVAREARARGQTALTLREVAELLDTLAAKGYVRRNGDRWQTLD